MQSINAYQSHQQDHIVVLSWQEFEQASRDVIRSIGYYVHPGPYMIYQKHVDIYGEHHRFYSWKADKREPHLFVGECKQWKNPIHSSVVYELKGLLDSIRSDHTVQGAVFTEFGASSRAEQVAQREDIMIFDRDDITSYLRDIYQKKAAGKLNRPSFPGYTKLDQVMDIVNSISYLSQKKDGFTSGDLKPILSNKFSWKESTVRDWTTSLLNIATILGLIEYMGKRGPSNLYQEVSSTATIGQLWGRDPEKVKVILQPIVIKNLFIREVMMYLIIQGPTIKTEIQNALEYSRAGFDQESIRCAIDLARDLGILENTEPSNFRSPITVVDQFKDGLWK